MRKAVISESWDKILGSQYNQPHLKRVQERLGKDVARLCPKPDKIFRALKLTSYEDTKVVILGQDPYYNGTADGLAFSSGKMTPSLDIIFKEIKDNTGIERICTRLDDWALQGVLLLNTILTTTRGTALAHKGIGWEQFTQYIIQRLNEKKKPLVVLLWGRWAIEYEKFFNTDFHHILKAPHPAADVYGFNSRTFRGCRHFESANDILKSIKQSPIRWGDPKL